MKVYSKDYYYLPTINKQLVIITYGLLGKIVTSAKVESNEPLCYVYPTYDYCEYITVTKHQRISHKAALNQHNAAIDNVEEIKAKALGYYSTTK